MRVTLASRGQSCQLPSGAQGREGRKACQKEPVGTTLPHPEWVLGPRGMGHCSWPGEETIRTQTMTVTAGTRSSPVPLQQLAQSQAVQVLDSPWPPGAILSPSYEGEARSQRLVGSPAPSLPSPTCPWLLRT